MFMFKTEIVIDEKKVLQEGIYSLSDIYKVLDSTFAQYNLSPVSSSKSGTPSNTHIYRDNGSPNDFANMWNINLALKEKRWFRYSVSKWLWYVRVSDNPNDVEIEDLKYYYITNPIEVSFGGT